MSMGRATSPLLLRGSSRGRPSRLEYLSPQGLLLPRVYDPSASPLWLELRGLAAWQATPSWTVYRLACHRLLPWLRVSLAMVPDAAWPGSDQRPWGTARWVGWVAPVRRTPGVWFVVTRPSAALGAHVCAVSTAPSRLFTSVRDQRVLVCGVCGHFALVHRCARPAWSCARCAWPLGACSPVCVPGVFRAQCPWPPGAC